MINFIKSFFMKQLFTKGIRRSGLLVGAALLAVGFVLSAASLSRMLFSLTVDDTIINAAICSGNEYTFNGEQLSEAGAYTATFTAADGSDSVVILNLEVLPTSATDLTAAICDGASYVFQGETLTETGLYSDTLTAANGCDSVVTLDLSVVAFFETDLTAAICPGDTFFFHLDTLTEAGIYTDTLTATGGCDSIVSLTLRVLPESSTLLAVSICEGSAYIFNGDTLTSDGVYRDTFAAVNGCDSVVTLRLSQVSFFTTELSVTLCEGEAYLFGSDTLTTAGVYTDTLTAVGGCDSILLLTLDVLPNSATNLAEAICPGDTLFFNGDTLTMGGDYTYVYPAANGCDSTVTLALTLLEKPLTELSASLCDGDSLLFNGAFVSESGLYEAILTAANGCDSVVTLALEVLPNTETALSATVCAGEVFVFDGQELFDSGIYTAVYPAANGCDSTVTLALTVLPETTIELSESICAGQTLTFNGIELSEAGQYEFVLADANGCDSTILLTLDVRPTSATNLDVRICAGESYTFDGQELSESGQYEAVFTAANGCDSLVSLSLTVLTDLGSALEVSICEGESYEFGDQVLTESGAYEATFSSAEGCDSLVTLQLTVLENPLTFLSITICEGETYEFDGQTLGEGGAYSALYAAANGCDSLVTLELTVLESPLTLLTADICEGGSYEFDGQILTEGGAYSALYTAAGGCDSLVTLELTVLENPLTLLTVGICEGDSYEFDGQILTEGGAYSALYTAANGCDSLVTLELTVLPHVQTSLDISICEGETYTFDGQELAVSGTYTAQYATVNGCDSLVTLELEILPNALTFLAISICEDEAYEFDGQLLTQSGAYSALFTAANGCDSLVTLELTVSSPVTTVLEAEICEGAAYEYNGEILTEGGDYVFVFDGSNGCDSLVTLRLSILPLPTSLATIVQCVGTSYVFDGLELTESGIYTALGIAANGCDSLAILDLTFVTEFQTPIEATICDGATYEFGGELYAASGLYTDTLTAVGGCDSILLLQLTVLQPDQTTLEADICAGDAYEFGGEFYTEPGAYTLVLANANGCDSVVTLNLSVLPTALTELTATICQDEGYTFNDELLTEAGTYEMTLTAANGCDSIVRLQLDVIPTSFSTIGASICAGESFSYLGQELTESGSYQFVLSSSLGCDSVVNLNLQVRPLAETLIEIVSCDSAYVFNNTTFTASGQYPFVIAGGSVNGCDSIVTLSLTLLEPTPITFISADICAGETYPFNGANLSQPGSYIATVQGANGCDSTIMLALSVTTVNTAVSITGITLTAAAQNATFQWINCATNMPIDGATDSSFTPDATGNYAVIVTQNNCSSTSQCIEVVIVSNQDVLPAHNQWQVQPNPAKDHVALVFHTATTTDLDLAIFDSAGRLLVQRRIPQASERFELDLSDLPDGLLMVRIANQAEVSTKRLLKAAN